MEELKLSETLQRYFSDFFVCCDEDNTGKVPMTKAIELIKSGNVSSEVLAQISDMCWNQNTNNYLNRRQFYSALKLVAAHQLHIPLKSELITAALDLPLPRFTWPNSENHSPCPDLIELRINDISDYREQIDTTSTDSEFDSNTLRTGSPDVSSIASDSPTPTNSVQDKSWAVSGTWQGLLSEEQRQLLGTEEESSDRHSSEEDTEISNEVWTITQEQRDYYTTQFRSLQPDTSALLAGPIARMFFEKSRLPVQELRKIWQLSDITKDGALNLQEFLIAMHLVVLRRNHIELPDTLPLQLLAKDENTTVVNSEETKDVTSKEWTKFVESPTSSISSPGPKPVNFDFQKVAVDRDPKILHPVALRLTPEYGVAAEDQPDAPEYLNNDSNLKVIQRPQAKKKNVPGPGAIPPPPTSVEDGPVSLPAFPPPKKEKPPPPPPRPFKTHGRSSSLDLNRINKNNSGTPPSVPPRASPTKKISEQHDFANFEQFQQTVEEYENVAGAEEGIFPGDLYEKQRKVLFAQFSAPEGTTFSSDIVETPQKHGAFEIYRKPKNEDNPGAPVDQNKWDLFQKLQEQNTVLLRLCQELSQELADVKEEKMSLKVKLEHQKQLKQNAA